MCIKPSDILEENKDQGQPRPLKSQRYKRINNVSDQLFDAELSTLTKTIQFFGQKDRKPMTYRQPIKNIYNSLLP